MALWTYEDADEQRRRRRGKPGRAVRYVLDIEQQVRQARDAAEKDSAPAGAAG